MPTLYVKQMLKAAKEVLSKQLEDVEKFEDEKARKVVAKIHRQRFWIEQNENSLADADAKKRREIAASLAHQGERP